MHGVTGVCAWPTLSTGKKGKLLEDITYPHKLLVVDLATQVKLSFLVYQQGAKIMGFRIPHGCDSTK